MAASAWTLFLPINRTDFDSTAAHAAGEDVRTAAATASPRQAGPSSIGFGFALVLRHWGVAC